MPHSATCFHRTNLELLKAMSTYEPGKPIPAGTVKNYLVESILVLLCCFWPTAIVAIINATKVNSLLAAGDYNGAMEASNNAKKWVTISMVIGLVCVGGSILINVIVAVMGAAAAGG
jgi:hypothetical protein